MAKKKRKPPSRSKYETGHPVVSFRVPRQTYDQVLAMKAKGDSSFADIFMVGYGKIEALAEREEEIARKARADGFAETEKRFKVTYPCSVCGKPISLTSEKEKAAIRTYMQAEGWGHAECHERRRRS